MSKHNPGMYLKLLDGTERYAIAFSSDQFEAFRKSGKLSIYLYQDSDFNIPIVDEATGKHKKILKAVNMLDVIGIFRYRKQIYNILKKEE